MNMHLPELHRLQQEHRARRKGWQEAARLAAVPKLLSAPRPVNLVTCRQQNAHVITWQIWLANEATKCKTYIRRRCEEENVSLNEMLMDCRRKPMVRLRDIIVYELKTFVKPGISFPELGRLFGKDHTTMILSYWRGAMIHGDKDAEEAVRARRQQENDRARRYRKEVARS